MELSILEVAKRLNMPIETVRRWIRQGKIPMQHHHGRYTIHSDMLQRWADECQLKIQAPAAVDAQTPEPRFDGILAAMRRGGIVYGLEADTKEAALRECVEKIPNIDPDERGAVFEGLMDRERLASTGIGHGIALPHPRSNLNIGLKEPQISTCFFSRPIDFEAIDHRPVSVLMILLSDSTKLHLILLSKLSFYLRDRNFRNFLLGAPPVDVLLGRVDQMEAGTLASENG